MDRWETTKVLNDPAFKDFIDGLYNCGHIVEIRLFGSLAINGYEPFKDDISDMDIDIWLKFDGEKVGNKVQSLMDEKGIPATPELKSYLEKFEEFRPEQCNEKRLIYIPSPLAGDVWGKKYRIHIRVGMTIKNKSIVLKRKEVE